MKEYPVGNLEIIEMINSGGFDEKRAKEILAGTDLNRPINVPIGNTNSYFSTTYLYPGDRRGKLPALCHLYPEA